MPEQRRCPDCEETKPLGDFPPLKGGPSGRRVYCRPCHNTRSREWYQRNRRIVETYYELSETPDIQLAYIAGFVDGEGYIGINPNRMASGRVSYSARVTITQTSQEVIEFIANLSGVKCHGRQPKAPDGRLRRYQWYVNINGQRAFAFIRAIRPWLRVKHHEADLLLQLPAYGNGLKRMGRKGGVARTPEQEALSVHLWEELKRLHRG